MPDRDGLMITGHAAEATCGACGKTKECIHLESVGAGFEGWVCFTHLRTVLRLSLSKRPRHDQATPLFDNNGAREVPQA